MPGSKIAVTHGQPQLHWERDENNVLCINLESMCEDFEESVESFVHAMRADRPFRDAVIQRWRDRRWEVRPFVLPPSGVIRTEPVQSVSASGPTKQTNLVTGTHMIVPVKPPES